MDPHLSHYRRTLLTLILAAAFLWSLTAVPWTEGLIHPGGWSTALDLLGAMLTPDLSSEVLSVGLAAAWRTVAYATAGMTLAVLVGYPLGVLASGTLPEDPALSWLSTGMFRGLLAAMRSIHELVWAWLFVAAVGLTPAAAIAAITIPYAGILGRILADHLNDVRDEPLRALRSAGAGRWQLLFYGRLPEALADLVSYTMFRFECAIRSAAIMSFVGLGGLGYQIQISLDDLHFHEAWTFVYLLIGLVVAAGIWSARVREALVR